MGNRSSSHYPPPLAWSRGQQYPAYAAPIGAYDPKRANNGPGPPPPGAYIEPFMPHPILCRSMTSLNADSGYLTSPSDSERMRLSKGSRMSLNHLDFEQQRPILFPPDLKTIKKLEKMEKKQQKLLKKIGGRPFIPPPPPGVFFQSQPMPPPPPPPPLYSRAMSFDDLYRNHLLVNDPRQRELWRAGPRFRSPAEHVGRSTMSTNQTTSQVLHGSSMTSSPVTSVSDGQTGDGWRVSPVRRDAKETLSPVSETSATHGNATQVADTKNGDKSKSVEIKVERTERVERREKIDNKDWLNSNDVYAMPKMQPSLGSRSSLATSQARGGSSDIDFSWIREEENKLRNERENIKQLPKCYFGMDPPKLDATTPLSCNIRDEKENRRTAANGNVRTTAAAFENELIRERRRDQAQKSRSSTHLEDHPVPQRELGPMARRLQRMQREAEVTNRNYDERGDNQRQQWRSSMAF